jgi:hypothetical protein
VTDLLELALEAHGGLERWRQAWRLKVHAHVGDGLFIGPGRERILRDVLIELDPHVLPANDGKWNCLIAPFVLTTPGVDIEEIAGWEEAGEEWRRLKAVLPEGFVRHTTEHVYSFNRAGLLRRYDCHSKTSGVATSATYAAEHRSFDGLMMAARHRTVPRDSDGRTRGQPVLMMIDVLHVQVENRDD